LAYKYTSIFPFLSSDFETIHLHGPVNGVSAVSIGCIVIGDIVLLKEKERIRPLPMNLSTLQ